MHPLIQCKIMKLLERQVLFYHSNEDIKTELNCLPTSLLPWTALVQEHLVLRAHSPHIYLLQDLNFWWNFNQAKLYSRDECLQNHFMQSFIDFWGQWREGQSNKGNSSSSRNKFTHGNSSVVYGRTHFLNTLLHKNTNSHGEFQLEDCLVHFPKPRKLYSVRVAFNGFEENAPWQTWINYLNWQIAQHPIDMT